MNDFVCRYCKTPRSTDVSQWCPCSDSVCERPHPHEDVIREIEREIDLATGLLKHGHDPGPLNRKIGVFRRCLALLTAPADTTGCQCLAKGELWCKPDYVCAEYKAAPGQPTREQG